MFLTILARTLVNDGSFFSHLLTDVCNSLCSPRGSCQRLSSSHHVQLSPPDQGRIEERCQASTAGQITNSLLFFHLRILYPSTSPSFVSRHAHNNYRAKHVSRTIRDARLDGENRDENPDRDVRMSNLAENASIARLSGARVIHGNYDP